MRDKEGGFSWDNSFLLTMLLTLICRGLSRTDWTKLSGLKDCPDRSALALTIIVLSFPTKVAYSILRELISF